MVQYQKYATKNIKVLALSGLSLCLISCSTAGEKKWYPIGMPKTPKEGSAEYKLGWRDGCDTGISMYGNDYLRALYKLEVDPKMMANHDYKTGWKMATRYCRYYTSSYLAAGMFDRGFGVGIFDNWVADDTALEAPWGLQEDAAIFSGLQMPLGWDGD